MMIRIKLLSLGLLLILLCGCGREQDKEPVSDPAASFMALNDPESDSANTPPNILLIIADDLGVEQLASFGIGAQPAVTPNLDQLASQGMSFVNVWSQPICSPTRATLLTGRYGFRTGVGTATPGKVHGDYPELARAENGGPDLSGFDNLADKPLEVYENLGPVFRVFNTYFANDDDPADGPFPSGYGLPINEYTLPEILRSSAANYSTGVIGKWHLGDNRNGWLQHPGNAGFDYFSVNMLNQPESFYAWYENVNGELEQRTGYTPEQKVDDAIDWLDEQKQDDKPWLLWLAFNLPHYPHHIPEVAGLETDGLDPTDHRSALDVMTSRMDQEIGRLLDAIGAEELENTIVLLVGDNGTTGEANDPPFHPERGKFTLYEGGIRVPLIISGPGIPAGAQSTALVNTTDIFATLVELSGNKLPEELVHDSVSLAPYFDTPSSNSIRDFMFADAFYAGSGIEEGAFTVRDDRFKLIRWHDHQELYDLENDPYENADLLADGESEDERTIISLLERLVMRIRSI
jgi:arylsulfatase B